MEYLKEKCLKRSSLTATALMGFNDCREIIDQLRKYFNMNGASRVEATSVKSSIFVLIEFERAPNLRNQDKFKIKGFTLSHIYRVKRKEVVPEDKYTIENISTAVSAWHNVREVKRPQMPFEPIRWQKELIDEINTTKFNSTNRKIIWYYDYIGNSGKSYLSMYLANLPSMDFLRLSKIGLTRDFSELIYNAVYLHGWTCKCLLIDLPRTCEKYTALYECLENIKNGEIFKEKWSSDNITLNNINNIIIIIFANFLPDYGKLSADRWDIRERTDKEEELDKIVFSRWDKETIRRMWEASKNISSTTNINHEPIKLLTNTGTI